MSASTPFLEIRNVCMDFVSSSGNIVRVFDRISFDVPKGQFVSLVGPSGCGKSTLIRLLAGLIQPTSGEILENGEKIRREQKNRGLVFQNYNLFPWLTVEENIGFGLKLGPMPSKQQKDLISHYVDVVGLRGFEKSYPKELSGGMQQRVALARTLVTNPKILLMDEPFSALDTQTKRLMQNLLLQILQNEGHTVVFVTHDVEEAVFLSDVVYIMTPRPGSVRERVAVDFPRPRDLNTEYSEKFITTKKYIQEIITKEALGLTKLNLDIYKNLTSK